MAPGTYILGPTRRGVLFVGMAAPAGGLPPRKPPNDPNKPNNRRIIEPSPTSFIPLYSISLTPEQLETIQAILVTRFPDVDPETIKTRTILGLRGKALANNFTIDEGFCLFYYQYGRVKEILRDEAIRDEATLAAPFFRSFNGTAVALLEKTDDKEVVDLIRGAVASKKALSTDDLSGAVTTYSFRGKLITALDATQPATVWKLYNDTKVLFTTSVAGLKLSSSQLAVLIGVADQAYLQAMNVLLRQSQSDFYIKTLSEAQLKVREKAWEAVADYKDDCKAATADISEKEKVSAAILVMERNNWIVKDRETRYFSSELAMDLLKESPVEAVEQLSQQLSAANSSIASRVRFFLSGLPGLRWIGGEARSIFDLILQIIASVSDPKQLQQIVQILSEQKNVPAEKLLDSAMLALGEESCIKIFSGKGEPNINRTGQAIADIYSLLSALNPKEPKQNLAEAAIKPTEALKKITTNQQEAQDEMRAFSTYLERTGLPFLLYGLSDKKTIEETAQEKIKSVLSSSDGRSSIASILSIVGNVLKAQTQERQEEAQQSIESSPLFETLKIKDFLKPEYRHPYYVALRPLFIRMGKALVDQKFNNVARALKEVSDYLKRHDFSEPYTPEQVLEAFLVKSLKILQILEL